MAIEKSSVSINIYFNPFLCYCSDTPTHIVRGEDFTKETFLFAMRNATDLIKRHFVNKTVLPVIGNHDYFPRNQLPAQNSEIYNAIAEMWEDWLPGDTLETFKNGG